MSATEILEELPGLTPAELEIIYQRAVELHQGQSIKASPELLAAIDAADEEKTDEIVLRPRGATRPKLSWEETAKAMAAAKEDWSKSEQAGDLRARLKTFAEDWERPEAAIYDEDPAR